MGFQIVKRILIKENKRTTYKIILFRTFLVALGYSTLGGENIHVMIGITRLEIFTSFTIKKGWLI